MKILCLLSHPRADILLRALSRLEGAEVRNVDAWPAFMDAVMEENPELVFLGFRALLREGDEAVESAPWAMRALGIPSVAAFADHDELSACGGSLQGFDGICLLSDDAEDIATVCAAAIAAHASRATEEGALPAPRPPAAALPPDDDVTPFDPDDVGFQEDLYGPEASSASGNLPVVSEQPNTAEQEALDERVFRDLAAEPSPLATPTSGSSPAVENLFQVQLELPSLESGEVSALSFSRLLLAIELSRRTGELVLRNGNIERRFVVSDGEVGRLDQPVSGADEAKLFSSITWTSGTYAFLPGGVPRPRFYGFGSAASVVLRSVQRHASVNEIASSLVRHFKSYPTAATSSEALIGLRGASADLARFLDAADGHATLEEMLAHALGAVDATMQFVHVCWSLGGLVFLPDPADRPVAINLRRPKVAGAFKVSDEAGETASGPVSSSSNSALQQLEELHARFGKSDPYAAFGLAPGCGLPAVERRYYELVREFHPDRFGRSNHPSVRSEADALFVRLRDLHSILGGLERGRTPAEPTPATGFVRPGTNPTMPSVAARAVPPRPAEARPSSAQAALEAARRSGGQSAVQSGVMPRAGVTSTGVSPTVRTVATQAIPTAGPAPSSSRTVAMSAVAGATVSQASRTVAPPAVGRVSGEQLFRNAQKVLETGAVDKAWDMLVAARQKGAQGPLVDAHEAYLMVMRKKLDTRTAKKQIEKTLEDLVEPHLRSSAAVLLGHVARLEENYTEALACYRQATDIDGNNQEANRWVRHLRQQLDKAKKPTSFLDKLLAPKKQG